jgi:hypothetical protein
MSIRQHLSRKPSGLEKARTDALNALETEIEGTPEYNKILANVKELSELIQAEKPKSEKLSPNTIVVVAGNLVVAALVIAYERENVVSTKVQNFLNKPPKS